MTEKKASKTAGAGKRKRSRRRRKRGGRPESPRRPEGRGRRRKKKAPERSANPLARLARKHFGVSKLHAEQEQVMEAVLAGQDTLAVLPTGFGKSLCYQVPALMKERPTLVVSPLVALMADQEQALKTAGIPVVRLDSTLLVAQRRAALERVDAGGSLVILITPESLESKTIRPHILAAEPWLLCIDEAHCISEWGHDFRPAYLRLGTEARELGVTCVLALTATATPHVRADILERLGMRAPKSVVASPHRPNLELEVQLVTAHDKPVVAGKLLRDLGRPAILYCSTTIQVDRIALALSKARISSGKYHGKMPKAERTLMQTRFSKGTSRMVLVATSAFGMGIDKPNIRTILHYQAPGSLEQYAQEAGRGGRDGKRTRCVLLYDEDDLRIQRYLQKQGRATPDQLRRVGKALRAWAGEDRPVAIAELALSAGCPRSSAGTICAELESLGGLERDSQKRYHVAVSFKRLTELADDLARRFETKRKEDEHRLEALDEYAKTETCRAAFLRRWFGEEDPPDCGTCDNCRPLGAPSKKHHVRKRRPSSGKVRGKKRTESKDPTGRKPRRRKRSRRKPRRGGSSSESKGS